MTISNWDQKATHTEKYLPDPKSLNFLLRKYYTIIIYY